MATELSSVLGHIETISKLELDDVAPTSHVVEVANALRADVVTPACRATSRSPKRRPSRTTASSSRARRHERPMTDSRRSPPSRPPTPSRPATSMPPSCSRPTAPRPRPTSSTRSRGWPTRRRSRDGARSSPLAGVPLAVKDLFCTEGVPSQSGSRILEGYLPPYSASVVAAAHRRRRAAAGQDQPGRVRDGLVQRELRLRPGPEPLGPHARPRRLVAAAAPPRSPRAPRPGRWAPTPAARSASPPR